METLIESHNCSICGKVCVITLLSIGTSHQWVTQVICSACVTPEHLSRVGRHRAESDEGHEEGS